MDDIFLILKPQTTDATFAAELDDLCRQLRNALAERQLTSGNIILAKFFLTDTANQWAEVQQHALCTDILVDCGVSYIEQPPLDGHKVALLICLNAKVQNKKMMPDGMTWQEADGTYRHIFQTVRLTAEEASGKSAYEQTRMAFERHIGLLRAEGLTLRDNGVRTWLYVRDIDVNYADVVRARNDIFDREGLTRHTHYIASTGIGGQTAVREASVAIDFYSVAGLEARQVRQLQATDFLNPTYEYGVAFERGTRVAYGHGARLFISGTASIDKHGQCLYRGDVRRQTERLLVNIEKLLEDGGGTMADVSHFIVYLRDVADREWVQRYMDERFPRTPFVITEARVCRPEWLIEMECMAETQTLCFPNH